MDWITAGLSILGIASDLIGGRKAEKAADKEGEAAAKIDERVTAEKLFSLDIEERTLAGETRARAAGSGVKVDQGSPLTILAEQAATFARERGFISEVGAEKASLTRRHASNIGDRYRYAGYGSAINRLPGIGQSIFSALGK